jgi:hypothetical protein
MEPIARTTNTRFITHAYGTDCAPRSFKVFRIIEYPGKVKKGSANMARSKRMHAAFNKTIPLTDFLSVTDFINKGFSLFSKLKTYLRGRTNQPIGTMYVPIGLNGIERTKNGYVSDNMSVTDNLMIFCIRREFSEYIS